MKDHIRNIKSHQTDESAVAAYVWEEGDRIEEAKLLKHIQNSSSLNVWEKLFIQKYKLIAMNFDIPSEKNQIYK
jgi:hypothetical protein